METLRGPILRHSWLALLLVCFALFAKVAIPAGFMPNVTSHGLVIELCTGTGPVSVVIEIPSEKGAAGKDQHKGGKADAPCAFAGLGAPALAGADPAILAIALAFILALGLCVAPRLPSTQPRYLRPPLRAPPAGC